MTVAIKPNQHPHSGHPYAMTFRARDDYFTLYEETWFSTGSGQVCKPGEPALAKSARVNVFPFAFQNATQLQELCQRNGLSVAALMMKNELHCQTSAFLHDDFNKKWEVMKDAVCRGMHTEGLLPGPYQVNRRACALYKSLQAKGFTNDFLTAINWVNTFAIAVSEENAAGGRVVTAPTNGASGIIPAVLCCMTNSFTRLILTPLPAFF